MARPDGLVKHKRGYKFEVLSNIEMASSQMQLHQESLAAIDQIAGIHKDRMEIRSNAQLARKQASDDIVVVPIFDNLRRSRRMVGKLIYELIKQFFDQEMIFNITDQGTSKQVVVTQDHLQTIKESMFDVIVEEMPDVTNIQSEQFSMIGEILRSMPLPPSMAIPLTQVMIQMSELRNKEQLMQMMQQMSAPPPDMPKISLSLTWDSLAPEEKAVMANLMGQAQLAQWELQAGLPPTPVMKDMGETHRAQIKNQGNNPELDMAIKSHEHQVDMQNKQESHEQKLQKIEQMGKVKMTQQYVKGVIDARNKNTTQKDRQQPNNNS
jgi:hypothetical protein